MTQKSVRFGALIALVVCSSLFISCADNEQEEAPSKPAATASTPTANATTSKFSGVVDGNDCQVVRGWVWNGTDPKLDINVELYVDDKLVETIPARTLRPDLKSKKIGTGEYGFSFKLPSSYKDGNQHRANVKVAGSDYTIPNSQGVFEAFTCK